MSIWLNCHAEVFHSKKKKSEHETYKVEINDTQIIVTVDEEEIWCGINDGTGHFNLTIDNDPDCQASLHIDENQENLEGKWRIGNEHGMWVIELNNKGNINHQIEISENKIKIYKALIEAPSNKRWDDEYNLINSDLDLIWEECQITMAGDDNESEECKEIYGSEICKLIARKDRIYLCIDSDENRVWEGTNDGDGNIKLKLLDDSQNRSESSMEITISPENNLMHGYWEQGDCSGTCIIKLGKLIDSSSDFAIDLVSILNNRFLARWINCVSLMTNKSSKEKLSQNCIVEWVCGDIKVILDNGDIWHGSSENDGFFNDIRLENDNDTLGNLRPSKNGGGLEGKWRKNGGGGKWEITLGQLEEETIEELRKFPPAAYYLAHKVRLKYLIGKILHKLGCDGIESVAAGNAIFLFSLKNLNSLDKQIDLIKNITSLLGENKYIKTKSNLSYLIDMKVYDLKGCAINMVVVISFRDVNGKGDVAILDESYVNKSDYLRDILGRNN